MVCRRKIDAFRGSTYAALLIGVGLFVASGVISLPSAVAQEEGGAANSGSSAEEDADFETLVEEGRNAYSEEDWLGAAEAFERAYQQRQIPNLLYNIGRSYENAGEFKKAIQYYEQFINQPDIDIDNRKDALDRIDTLEKVVDVSDEEEREQAEAEEPETPGSAETTEPDTDPTVERRDDYTLAVVLLSTGGAGLISGTVFSILTANAHSDFESAENLSDRRDAADRGRTFGTLADAFLISGGALTAAGVGLVVWPLQTETATESEARLRPVLSPHRAGLQLDVQF